MELKTLIATVSAHDQLLGELVAVLERETAELSAIDIAAMTRTNQDKEDLHKNISEHSLLMRSEIETFARQEGMAAETSLGSLAGHLAQRGQKALQDKQKQLKSKAERVKLVAEMNREIASRFSTTISSTLNLITRLINQSNVYGSTGGFQQRPAGAVMINKEA